MTDTELAMKSPSLTYGELKLLKSFQHHGVVGMKWGQRRGGSGGSGGSKKSAKPKAAASTKPQNTLRNKPNNRRMTDAELRNRLNRLQMEKQYRELTTSPKGKSFVRELMADTGKQAARQLTQTAVKVGLQLALEGAAKNSKGSTGVFLAAMAAQGAKKGPKVSDSSDKIKFEESFKSPKPRSKPKTNKDWYMPPKPKSYSNDKVHDIFTIYENRGYTQPNMNLTLRELTR